MSAVGSRGRPDADALAALQRRVDQVAGELFAAPAWPLPTPIVRVDPRVPASTRALASTHQGVGLIRVSPTVAAEPADYLRGTLAHEAGHVALGHQRAAHTGWALAISIPLWAVAITCCAIGVKHSAVSQTSLWFALAAIPAVLALCLIVMPSRRNELAADLWSTRLVGTTAVLAALDHLHHQRRSLARAIAHLGFDTHPSPQQRARRLGPQQRLPASALGGVSSPAVDLQALTISGEGVAAPLRRPN